MIEMKEWKIWKWKITYKSYDEFNLEDWKQEYKSNRFATLILGAFLPAICLMDYFRGNFGWGTLLILISWITLTPLMIFISRRTKKRIKDLELNN